MALTLENETWTQAEVAPEFQELANQLSAGPPLKTETSPETGADYKLAKELIVNGQKFHVVNSALMLLKMLNDYLQCLEQIPSLTTDILQRLIDLLQVS
jgi:vacuolar protein sorting-associated protein 54